MFGVYRNLNSRKANNGNDLWSIVNGHESDGKFIKTKGVQHGVNFSVKNPIQNNVTSQVKGSARIVKNNSKEVVAMIGGTPTDHKPIGQIIGRLTLDTKGTGTLMIITDKGLIPLSRNTELWFGNQGCIVHKI